MKIRALYIQTEEFKKMNVCRKITYWVGLFCIGVSLGLGVGIAVRFAAKAGTIFFSTAPRWALESTKPHIQWVLVLLIRDEKAGAWSSQLCFIWCRTWECVELYFHSQYLIHMTCYLLKQRGNFTFTYIQGRPDFNIIDYTYQPAEVNTHSRLSWLNKCSVKQRHIFHFFLNM
jgi:hypothetical protein